MASLALRATAISHCCSQLAHYLGSIVSLPGNTNYTAIEASYFSIQEAALSPYCFISPRNAQDVSKAVSIIVESEGCDFAIKGHSHMPAAGFANIANGITIDMVNMDTLLINDEHTIASVGAGASWFDVYEYLDKYNVSVAGGRNGNVGVGGLTLGGGISYFAPRVGWACDNVVNFEVVLVSGAIVSANRVSNHDLFQALKGGWNNFGVVTRIDLATFPLDKIVASTIVNSISDRARVFKAFFNIASSQTYDIYASLVTGLTFSSTNKMWSLSTAAIYTKPDLSPAVYKELLDIPQLNTTKKPALTKLSSFSNETKTPQLNWAFYTSSYGVSENLLERLFDSFNETMYEFDVTGGVTWSIALEPLPTAITRFGILKGGNSLGTSPRDGNTMVLLLAALWPDSSSNSLVEITTQKMLANADSIARKMNLFHDFKYINYAAPVQHPIASYGAENVARMRAASKKYDPKGVFQKRVPGGFKLF